MSAKEQPGGKSHTPRRTRKLIRITIVCLVAIGYVVASYMVPLPAIQSKNQIVSAPPAKKVALQWPSQGQTALGALGYNVLDQYGDLKPAPTASIAKVITALAVMKQYPLLKGQSGPAITIANQDIVSYQKYTDAQGSVVPVAVGEQLTEYQALQALLLPSANNIADLLANWAFGSMSNYATFANSFVKSLGLTQTFIDDASGFSPKTVSTARDLVLLGENVMDNPVLAEIVGQPQATIPIAGVITNVNLLVGHQEVVGIKTGNTDEAGGCFMVAARHAVDASHEVIVIAVVMGTPDLATAITSMLPLLESAYANFAVQTVVASGSVVGSYKPAWGSAVAATTTKEISGLIWKPAPPSLKINLEPLTTANTTNLALTNQVSAAFGRHLVSSPVTVAHIPTAPVLWRLLHPLR